MRGRQCFPQRKGEKVFVCETDSFLLTGSVFKLRGSVIKILDEIANRSMCVQFSYKLNQTFNPVLKEKVRLLHI